MGVRTRYRSEPSSAPTYGCRSVSICMTHEWDDEIGKYSRPRITHLAPGRADTRRFNGRIRTRELPECAEDAQGHAYGHRVEPACEDNGGRSLAQRW
jgi:hypothetical protein